MSETPVVDTRRVLHRRPHAWRAADQIVSRIQQHGRQQLQLRQQATRNFSNGQPPKHDEWQCIWSQSASPAISAWQRCRWAVVSRWTWFRTHASPAATEPQGPGLHEKVDKLSEALANIAKAQPQLFAQQHPGTPPGAPWWRWVSRFVTLCSASRFS